MVALPEIAPVVLTETEVAAVTGRERHRAQIRWLQEHGWVYEVNADGQPVVGRRYAEERLGGHAAGCPSPDVDLSHLPR